MASSSGSAPRASASRAPTEIGGMLEQLGAKVPVWCHADDMANGTLYLAARGCKQVWLSPAGSVDAIGLAAQTIYFHKLLADELGLDVDFLQVGKYKGAEEPFTRDGPSPEARESLQATLAGMRDAWLEGILGAPRRGPGDARGWSVRRSRREASSGWSTRSATSTRRATRSRRQQAPCAPRRASVPRARRATGDELVGPAAHRRGRVARLGAGRPRSRERRDLARGRRRPARRERRHRRAARSRADLSRLEKDDDVKAVVLRIDSPGGSALASDLLWHGLMSLRAKKPLVVSVGGMAASGGYYLASAGAVVFADASSIVGSIGVVGGKVAADRALEKIGVHAETIAAKPGDPLARPHARRTSRSSSPWDDATRDRLRQTMAGIYDLFLSRVAEGRGIPVERVAASAEGRIFAGEEGRMRGLVDEIGGLEQAIARARDMAGLAEDARVGVVDEPAGLIAALAGDDPPGNSAVPRPVASAPPSAALSRLTGELAPFVQSVEPLLGHERVLCAVPFALAVH